MREPTRDQIREAAARLGVSPVTIRTRAVRDNWGWERAMSTPRQNGGKNSRKQNPAYGNGFNFRRKP